MTTIENQKPTSHGNLHLPTMNANECGVSQFQKRWEPEQIHRGERDVAGLRDKAHANSVRASSLPPRYARGWAFRKSPYEVIGRRVRMLFPISVNPTKDVAAQNGSVTVISRSAECALRAAGRPASRLETSGVAAAKISVPSGTTTCNRPVRPTQGG